MEVAELDEVPDVGERGAEDSADADFVGGGSRHVRVRCWKVCSWQANGQFVSVGFNRRMDQGDNVRSSGYCRGSNQPVRGG